MSEQTALPLSGLDILIVENSSLAVDLNRVLRRRGGAASVEMLAHVAYAKRRLATPPIPDLVIIDHDLSDGSGSDLVMWMLTQPSLAEVVRVSYSGRETDAILAELHSLLPENGMESVPPKSVFHAYITKPDLHLVDTLGAVMRRVQAERPEADDMLPGATQNHHQR